MTKVHRPTQAIGSAATFHFGNPSGEAGVPDTRGVRVVGWEADHAPSRLHQEHLAVTVVKDVAAGWSEAT